MDGSDEPASEGSARSAGECRTVALEIPKHPPEQISDHGGIAVAVGVGEPIATGRCCPSDGRQWPVTQVKSVADVVEFDGMSEPGAEQWDHLAPLAEGAGLLALAMFLTELGHQMV